MKKLILFLFFVGLLVSCKNVVQEDVKRDTNRIVITETPEETDDGASEEPQVEEVVPEEVWIDATYDENDSNCSVAYIYVPKGWNPEDFLVSAYERYSERTEENFDFLKFEYVKTLTHKDKDNYSANSLVFCKQYHDPVTGYNYENYDEIDAYKVSVKESFDLDFIYITYEGLRYTNNNYLWIAYSLEKSEDGCWYIYGSLWDYSYGDGFLHTVTFSPNPTYPKLTISNYN